MTLYEEYRFKKPNKIADIQKASLFLNGKYEDEEKENIISECLRIKEKLEKEREHKKKVKATIDLAYDLYCKLANAVKELSQAQFQEIYEAVRKICFDGSDLKCNDKARQAAENLRSLSNDSNKCMEYLCFLRESLSAKRSAEVFAEEGESLLFEKKFSEIIKALRLDADKWQDTACITYYNRESNDIELENRFVYYAFSRHLDITKKADIHVSIIEPSPFFIRKWLNDQDLNGIKTDFVIDNYDFRSLEMEIYKGSKSACSFLSVEEFRKQLERGSSDYTLLFGNHMDSPAEKASLIEKVIREARDKNSFFMLGDDYEIYSPKSPVHQKLTEMSIRRIDLLPGDLLYATTPKKKMFVGAEYGYLNANEKNAPFYVVFYSLEKEGSFQSISPKTHFEKLPQEDFLSPKKQLRSVFYDGNRKFLTKTEKKRNQAEKYAFSNEIMFYYTIFSKDDSIPEKRIRAYACILDTDACYKERVLRSESEKLKIKISDIDEWLENEFPYHTKSTKEKEKISIQSLISEKFKAELKVCRKSKSKMEFPFRRISLKTFAFVYEDEIGESEKEIETLRFLGKSVLGDYDLTKISAGMLSSFIEENSSDFPSSVSKTVAVLHKLFDLAMELEQCNCNPVAEIEYKNRNRFEELDEVRTAISKRFFTIAEMDRMITKCFGKFEKGDNLSAAVLIRIFTGLDASIISALKWNDLKSFKTSTGKEIFQLNIDKKIGKDNNFAPLSKNQQIRLIPLCEELENIILSLREKERERYETISEDQFGEKAIIAGNDIILHAVTEIMLPERISKACKKLVKELKIDCDIIAVPENKYGVTDDNLNTYGGDIFRNSFRHYLLRSNDISNGELCYLLGIVSEDVDYDHYIDCSSDRKQEQLYSVIQKYAYLIRGVVCRGE